MHPPFAELPAAGAGAGLSTPGCPVLPLGRAVFGRHGAFVYEAGARLWLLSRSAHTELAIFDLFCPRLNWPPRLWPAPRKGRLRSFDVKRAAAEMMAAVPARGLTAAGRQYLRDRRGEIAAGCPVVALGVARNRGGGEATGVYDHACVYYAGPPADGLYAIRMGAHGRGAIMGLFAGTGHAEWLERLWPLPPGRWHRWDAEAAAGDLLAVCHRVTYGEPPPTPPRPSAEIVRLRPLPPPPCGRL